MNQRLNAAALAALAVLGTSAQAAISRPEQGVGNGSVFFVAMDGQNGAPGVTPGISLTVDLGYTIADFLPATSQTFSAGSLSAAGTTVVWNFNSNTRTTNGVASSDTFLWSGNYSSFLGAQANGYRWGVVGGDNVSGATASASNLITNRNTVLTGAPTAADMTALAFATPVSNAAANISNFTAASIGQGTQTQTAGSSGANTATAGQAFLNTVMKDNYGAYQTLSYLNAPGTTTYFNWVNQQANPVVYQLGQVLGVDAPSSSPATFVFDATANTLTYTVPVPEPGTYALLAAGLVAIGLKVRQRGKAAR